MTTTSPFERIDLSGDIDAQLESIFTEITKKIAAGQSSEKIAADIRPDGRTQRVNPFAKLRLSNDEAQAVLDGLSRLGKHEAQVLATIMNYSIAGIHTHPEIVDGEFIGIRVAHPEALTERLFKITDEDDEETKDAKIKYGVSVAESRGLRFRNSTDAANAFVFYPLHRLGFLARVWHGDFSDLAAGSYVVEAGLLYGKPVYIPLFID